MGNEHGVGEGIRQSGVAREDIFLQTKLAAEVKDYEGAKAAIEGSLKTLGVDYVDLFIIHSPQGTIRFRHSARKRPCASKTWTRTLLRSAT